MKKIISIFIIILLSFQIAFSEYQLSLSEEKKVEKAIILINNIIKKKGEVFKLKLLTKINQILARPNLSEKNIAIFTKLSSGISHSPVNQETTKKQITEEISPSDFQFVFSNAANRCKNNPCKTTEDFVKIQGQVKNTLVKYIEINNYRLNSYQGSDWEYNPNIAYNNFKDGENIYVINYLSSDSKVLFTEKFVINKLVQQKEINLITNPSPLEKKGETNQDIEQDEESNTPMYTINSDIPYVNEEEVREYWRGLLNKERTLLGLPDYIYDRSLDTTAKIWSDLAVDRGYIDHKVNSPSDSYYDYWKKAEWMKNNGVVCENISRATFSESIAWNNYYCKDTSKCTQELKKAVKRTYDFYMSEKGTDYDPHYRAIAHPLFQTMGLGLSVVDQGSGKYKMYLTNHYCTTNTK